MRLIGITFDLYNYKRYLNWWPLLSRHLLEKQTAGECMHFWVDSVFKSYISKTWI